MTNDHPLKAWRLRCNYTHREMAKVLNISAGSVARMPGSERLRK